MWPDRRILDLFKTEFPIVLAPMAGAIDADLAIAAAQGGGVPSVPCAMISPEKAREQVKIVRQRVSAPVNLNFFCHEPVDADPAREAIWRQRLAPYYRENGSIRRRRSMPPAARRSTTFLRGRGGAEAGNRQLPFRAAGAASARSRQGDRRARDVVGDDRARGRLARSSTASTSSLRKAPRPAAIAACS